MCYLSTFKILLFQGATFVSFAVFDHFKSIAQVLMALFLPSSRKNHIPSDVHRWRKKKSESKPKHSLYNNPPLKQQTNKRRRAGPPSGFRLCPHTTATYVILESRTPDRTPNCFDYAHFFLRPASQEFAHIIPSIS